MIRSLASFLLLTLFLFTGCNSANRKNTDRYKDIQSDEIVDRIETIKNIYHLCPSPVEMLNVVDGLDLEFDGEILNPMSNVSKYQDSRSMNQALGIYLSDLAYASLFGRTEESINYLELVKNLSEAADIEEVITDELIGNAKDNIDQLDSLRDISSKAFVNMVFFCERNDMPNTFFLISSGIFIESLFLTLSLIDEYEEAQELISHISDQKYAFEHLLILGEGMRTIDPNVEAVMQDLQTIRDIYNGMDDKSGRFNPAELLLLEEESCLLREKLIEG